MSVSSNRIFFLKRFSHAIQAKIWEKPNYSTHSTSNLRISFRLYSPKYTNSCQSLQTSRYVVIFPKNGASKFVHSRFWGYVWNEIKVAYKTPMLDTNQRKWYILPIRRNLFNFQIYFTLRWCSVQIPTDCKLEMYSSLM